MPTPHQITLVGIDSVDICAPLLSHSRAGYMPRRLSRDEHGVRHTPMSDAAALLE
jgi:hypothetical protein